MKQAPVRFEKLRMPLAWCGGVFLFLVSRPTEMGFRIGIPIALAGMLLRTWASGHMERKAKQLATGGPFAYVRNPLYLGSFFVGLGIIVIVHNLLSTVVFLVGFTVLYAGTIRKEEARLRETFGEPYLRYVKDVPRFIPQGKPYPARDKTPFRWRLLLQHRELETFLGLLLVFVGLYLWEEIVLEGQFLFKEKVALAVGLALIFGLVLERIFRNRLKAETLKFILP